jgi:hypothetical protein
MRFPFTEAVMSTVEQLELGIVPTVKLIETLAPVTEPIKTPAASAPPQVPDSTDPV